MKRFFSSIPYNYIEILFLCFLFPDLLFPQAYNISGKITAGDLPVKNAEVIFTDISDSTKKFSAISDSAGNYNLQILLTSVNRNGSSLPNSFELAQNYPNPFSNTTEILYRLNKQSNVTLVIYDILGQEIKKLNLGDRYTGIHSITWDVTNNFNNKVTPGVYFYQLQDGKEMQIKKMVYGTGKSTGLKISNTDIALKDNKLLKNEVFLFNAEIKNTDSTQPPVHNKLFDNITLGIDSIFDFETEAIDYKSFAIYFLSDTTLKIYQIEGMDLSLLPLASTPWITGEDIEFYDWSSHCMYLKKDKNSFFPELQYYYRFPKSWTERPWIVVADGIPCYAGYFFGESTTNFYHFPYISALEVGVYPEDIITSDWVFTYKTPDIRINNSVKEVLLNNNLYRGGIEIYFDTLANPIHIINGDTATVEYTINFKNSDQEDLYVFDPGKAGTKIFHFYNNGPNLYNANGSDSYWSKYKTTQNPEAWDSTWYTLIKSGESVTRTIQLKGYPYIPAGNYKVQLNYSCPREISKTNRRDSKGRYWIGCTRSNVLHLIIK